ncbi:hypothetical protein DPMN_113688 [Dreissena polymorpha]|uniref:Temptin Cys/Cys disulfide domain-containing protein n=2 Tax=Dreissena polymorpha TaxID=45954 RepID=A0A9D4QQW7_DREPO|nr:hypothetical protein DPMN_113688 [Dreissena polymorpha]
MSAGSALCFGVFLVFVFTESSCHPSYRDVIPNGHQVRDPCSGVKGDTWQRVGHQINKKYDDVRSKKKLNNFGKDFYALKKQAGDSLERIWPNLCPMNSDGDGRTNGEELGDPECVWTMDQPSPGGNMTIFHPGIPENEDGTLTEKTRQAFCDLHRAAKKKITKKHRKVISHIGSTHKRGRTL